MRLSACRPLPSTASCNRRDSSTKRVPGTRDAMLLAPRAQGAEVTFRHEVRDERPELAPHRRSASVSPTNKLRRWANRSSPNRARYTSTKSRHQGTAGSGLALGSGGSTTFTFRRTFSGI